MSDEQQSEAPQPRKRASKGKGKSAAPVAAKPTAKPQTTERSTAQMCERCGDRRATEALKTSARTGARHVRVETIERVCRQCLVQHEAKRVLGGVYIRFQPGKGVGGLNRETQRGVLREQRIEARAELKRQQQRTSAPRRHNHHAARNARRKLRAVAQQNAA